MKDLLCFKNKANNAERKCSKTNFINFNLIFKQKLWLSFLAVLFAFSLPAQVGSTHSSAYLVRTNNLDSVFQIASNSASDFWIKYPVGSNLNFSIDINSSNSPTVWKIKKMNVYQNTSNQMIGTDSLNSISDTSLSVYIRNGGVPDSVYNVSSSNPCRTTTPQTVGNNDTLYVQLIKGVICNNSFTPSAASNCDGGKLVHFVWVIEDGSLCSFRCYLFDNVCDPTTQGYQNCNGCPLPLGGFGSTFVPCTLNVCLGNLYTFYIGFHENGPCGQSTISCGGGCDGFVNVAIINPPPGSGLTYSLYEFQFTPGTGVGIYPVTVTVSDPCGNSCTSLFYVNVVPNNLNAAFTLPATACVGQQVCAIPTNASYPGTYTLTTGTSSNVTGTLPLQNNICFTATTAGVFTPNLTFADANGCGASSTQQLVVNPLAVSIATTQTCNIVSFNATPISCIDPGATYVWNFGDGTSAAGNPVTHIYTAVGTNVNVSVTVLNPSGASVMQTVQVSSIPSETNCCGANAHHGTGRTAVSVGPNPTTAFGLIINNANTNANATYNDVDYTVWQGSTIFIYSPSNYGGNTTITFSNCTFLMYPSSQIVLRTQNTANGGYNGHNQQSTLTVNFNNCHLYGCNQLWEGIRFDHITTYQGYGSGAQDNINDYTFTTNLNINNTLLEDAYTGVDNIGFLANSAYTAIPYVTSNLNFTTTGSMYNKNYIDFNLDQTKVSGFSKNSVYTCRNVNYDPPFVPLPVGSTNANYYTANLNPVSTTFIKPSAAHAIAINSIPSKNGIQLYFLNPNLGAINQAFDLSSNNNLYDNHLGDAIQGTAVNLSIGKQYVYNTLYGIQSSGTGSAVTGSTIKIGTNSTGANYFTNCSNSIYLNGKINTLNVSGNVIKNCSTYGIFVQNFNTAHPASPNCIINNNQMTNLGAYGIVFYLSLGINAQVQNNTINNTVNNTTSTGIVVNDYSPGASASNNILYDINTNHLSNIYNGISTSNTNSAKITSNTIQIYTPNPTVGYNSGISNINSYNDNINNNIITGNGIHNSFGQYGVNAADAVKSQIYCNIINGTNVGLNLQGPMQSNIYTNNIQNQSIDVWMLNSCVIGPQYNPNTSFVGPLFHVYEPSDNSFTHTAGTGYTSSFCQNSTNGGANAFYIRHGAPYDMLVNDWDHSIGGALMTPQYPVPFTAPGNNCSACTTCRQIQLARQVALDSLFAPADVRNTTVSRQRLFENLMLENISNTGDTAVDNFKTAAAANNIGKLFSVQTNIASAVAQNNPAFLTTAKQTNSSLAPANNIENWQKEVNAAYLTYIDSGFVFTASNLSILKQIAALCPFTDGTAVWQARALLAGVDSTIYLNPCEIAIPPNANTGSRIAHTENEGVIWQDAKTSIYPNPNTGSFIVNYTGAAKQLTVEVYSLLGSLVLSKQLSVENTASLQVENVEVGVYMVKLITDNVTIKTERVIVTK